MEHGFYVEVEPIIRKYILQSVYFFYFCGGRGIGKTYGALDLCRKIGTNEWIIDDSTAEQKFMYLRRTGVEAQSVAAPESCPFKAYNRNEGYNISADYNSKLGFGKFYMETDEEAQHIGYCAALSTFANLRGVDFSDVVFILYDECVPENKNKHPLKDEGYLFLNMMETINRNRIIEGRREVIVCMLSNAIDLGSALLSQLSITPILNTMIFKNQQKYTNRDRSLHIEKYLNHAVSEKKEAGALYKFASPTGFNERALSGEFLDNDLSLIKKVDLTEYKPFLTLENLCVYQHKTNGMWHISQTVTPAKYVFRAYEREKFREVFYWRYKLLVVDRKITYDNYATKAVFDDMIKFKPLV